MITLSPDMQGKKNDHLLKKRERAREREEERKIEGGREGYCYLDIKVC